MLLRNRRHYYPLNGGINKLSTNLPIELEQEDDGRWIEEIDDLDGVLVYGDTKEDSIRNVKTLALRVIADRLENGESLPNQVGSLIFSSCASQQAICI